MKKSRFLSTQLLVAITSMLLLFSGCEREENKQATNSQALHPLGVIEELPSTVKKVGFYQLPIRLKSLPTSIDYSNRMPTVRNQGTQGSCVGWAVGYYCRTYEKSLDFYWDVNGNAFSPSWIYNQINNGVDRGARISDAMNLVVNKGCDLLKDFPYDEFNFTRQPDAASFNRASSYKCASWQFLQNDVSTLKQILALGHVFVVGLKIYPDFDNLSSSNPIYDQLTGSSRGRHALCIVGYDDTKRAFKFINSWGITTYGINGYGWISYDLISNANLGLESYVFNPNYLNATISGPGSGYNGTTLNYSVNIIKGIGVVEPYTYYWELVNSDTEELLSTSTNSTFSLELSDPEMTGLKLTVTIKSANGISSSSTKYIANKGNR